MATGDILGIGVSGLLAFQRSLATTGHNISNVNTPGYSRQRVDLVSNQPQASGNGFIGTGVQSSTVQRIYDNFLTGQVRSATSANSQLQTYSSLAGQVDNLLADPTSGLNPGLQGFFDAVHTATADPASIPARQVLLSQANTLTNRFHYLDQRLSDLRQGINTQITTSVAAINNLASGIAKLNQQIVLAKGLAGGQPPNDLLDQRDALVAKLSEQVSVTSVDQNDGAQNIFIGTGQTLVVGGNASTLSVVGNPYDVTRYEVALSTGAITSITSDYITGGTLGGALDFRKEMLDPAQNALGRVAIGLATTFNDQHKLGQDLKGVLGQDFFNALGSISPKVYSTSAATLTASVSNVNALTTSDYRLDYNGANYTLTRLSDNAVISSVPFGAFPQTIASEGLTLTLTAGAVAGDSFLIQPTRTAAKDVSVVTSDPTRIALAGPLVTREATNANGLPTNLGTGKISAGNVTNTTALPLAAPITLTFNSATNLFNVVGGPGGTIAYNPATDSAGKSFTFAGFGGVTFSLSGVPSNGDSFTINNNTNGVSDNRNGLLLADLRNQTKLANSSATYAGAYGQLIADVGSTASRVDVSASAQKALLNNVTASRDSVSAVNLDEEAANMLRFQQAYQAAAQVISVSNTLFQTLITAVRG